MPAHTMWIGQLTLCSMWGTLVDSSGPSRSLRDGWLGRARASCSTGVCTWYAALDPLGPGQPNTLHKNS